MKVYYTYSSAFVKREDISFHQITSNYLNFKVGKRNLKLHQLAKQKNNSEVEMSEVIKIIRKNEKAIKSSDAVVVDLTSSSGGIGFQVALSLNERKPILALRYAGEERTVTYGPISARSNKNPLITYREYKNEDEITKHIDDFIEEAKNKIDTKFILIIPPAIDKYLSWASDFKRMHKAQVVRQAIEKEMSKDKDWKNYLKNDEF